MGTMVRGAMVPVLFQNLDRLLLIILLNATALPFRVTTMLN
jgi:hypothetical protein